jgi:hypothetical protein
MYLYYFKFLDKNKDRKFFLKKKAIKKINFL